MTAAVAAVALVAVAQVGAAESTTVHTVGSSGVPGADTGLVVADGATVTVTATGTVCPGGGFACVTPDGDPTRDTTQSGYGGFLLPGAPAWGLVARVGSGPWVHVGSGQTTLSGNGNLVFAVNDDYFGDNWGTFTATVSVSTSEAPEPSSCKPGWGYGDENHDHCGPPGLADRETGASSAGTHGKAKGKAA